MQEIIQYLMNNEEILNKVKEGTASLVGVNTEEVKAILEIFFDGVVTPKAYIWK